jgi:diguanylate cyclase (GGDEF)-like protein
VLPVDRQRIESALAEASQSGNEPDLEFRLLDSHGTLRWFWGKGRVMRDSAGQTRRVLGTMQEVPASVVTERRMRRHQTALLDLLATRRISQLGQSAAFEAITEVAGLTLETERTGIWLIEQDGSLRCASLYLRDSAQHNSGFSLTVDAFPGYFQALDSGRTLAVPDAQNDPRTAELCRDYLLPLGITSMLEATVRHNGRLVGVVCHEHVGPPRNWLLDEQSFAGSVADMVAIVLEAEERRRLAQALAESEQRYRNYVSLSTEGIVRGEFREPIDPAWPVDRQLSHLATHGIIAECNRPAALMLGAKDPSELLGRPLGSVLHAGAFTALATKWIESDYRLSEHETEVIPPDEQRLWLLGAMVGVFSDGKVAGLWTSFRDITHRKQSTTALEHQANHDSLTGLPNRKWLGERLARLLLDASQAGNAVALMMMDLDHFKEINDTMGHFAGDQLLKLIGPRVQPVLAAAIGELARLGGDEFGIVLPQVADQAAVESLAVGVVEALRQPFEIGGLRLGIDASVGAAIFPTHGQDASALMRCADIAMYEAKRRHVAVEIYNAEDDRHSPRRLALAHTLAEAIRCGEIVVHYQPIVGLKERRIRSVEALARWQHPEHGLLLPDEFIGLAEMSDQIRQLTLAILAEAIAQWERWRQVGFVTSVSVNLSTRVLLDRGFAEESRSALARNRMPHECLHFEITESAMLSDAERAIATLEELKRLGIGLSIDDFGIGFSSLSYLKRLPLHSVKIDKSFVRSMATSERDASIVRSTTRLAHDLGLRVVAEGVETGDVLALLQAMDCDEIQGFLIAPPQPGDQLVTWAREGNWL